MLADLKISTISSGEIEVLKASSYKLVETVVD